MGAAGFEEYIANTRFWRDRIIGRRARRHPFLGADDLAQVALMTLWEVWQKHGGLPPEELQRLGTTAMVRRVQSECRRQGYYGAKDVKIYSLTGREKSIPDPRTVYLRDKGDEEEWPMGLGKRQAGRPARKRPKRAPSNLHSIPEPHP